MAPSMAQAGHMTGCSRLDERPVVHRNQPSGVHHLGFLPLKDKQLLRSEALKSDLNQVAISDLADSSQLAPEILTVRFRDSSKTKPSPE